MKRSTPEHPKLLDLCVRLHIRRWEAVGVLESLWHFTAKFAPQGDVGKYPDAAIAKGIDWNRDPRRLVEALIEAGWIDKCECHRLVIHDWHDHADQTLKRFLASKGLAFVQHDASSKKPAQPTCPTPASPPLPLPLPIPEPAPTHAPAEPRIIPVSRPQDGWRTDQSFQPLVTAYQNSGAACIDEDFADTWWFVWRKLDFEQKLERTKAFTERVERGVYDVPKMIPRIRKFVEQEWKRPIASGDRKPVTPPSTFKSTMDPDTARQLEQWKRDHPEDTRWS
jgi:hypothetical protein